MINETPFKYELNQIATTGTYGKNNVFELVFHLKNAGKIAVSSIKLVNRHRDYVGAFTQVLMMHVTTTKAQHEQIIASDLSALEATLTQYDIAPNTAYSLAALSNPKKFKYKVSLVDAASEQTAQNNPLINRSDVGTNLLLQDFYIQLVDEGFSDLRLKTVGGIFRNTSGVDLIKYILSQFSSEDGKLAATRLKGVDIAPGVNTDKRSQIVIPHLTRLTKAIDIVNENSGGMWPTGFSYFCQQGLWYLFPTYDMLRFYGDERKLTVVNLPKNRVPTIERTYTNRTTGLFVLATRDAIVIDNRDAATIASGNATSFMDTYKVFDWGETVDNRLEVTASNNINEVNIPGKGSASPVLRPSDTRITANKNIELSKIAQRKGYLVQVIWENSDDDLIYPGMPCRLLYLKDNKPKVSTGTVIEMETNWYPVERSFTNRRMARMAAITMFVGEP